MKKPQKKSGASPPPFPPKSVAAAAEKRAAAELTEGLQRLASEHDAAPTRLGSRLRNYFLAGIIIVGPIAATIYLINWVIQLADQHIKPLVPAVYLPETYLPFAIPGIGIFFGVAGLTLIGALAANLFGRSLISYGEMVLDRMPIVRNIYRALKQIFESVVSASGPQKSFQKVGLIEFPSKGLWSIVFVTGEATGEVGKVQPGGETDLLTVFMPTGIVPPTGFICFVPRRNVIYIDMSVEDAAKVVISAGMVTPELAKVKPVAGAPAVAFSRLPIKIE